MKSSRRATIFVGLGIIAILTVWYFLFRAGNNQSRDIEASRDQSGQRHEAKSEAVGEVDSKLFRDRAKAWQAFFSTPIEFFGRVIDEEGRPVERAKTFYTVSLLSKINGIWTRGVDCMGFGGPQKGFSEDLPPFIVL